MGGSSSWLIVVDSFAFVLSNYSLTHMSLPLLVCHHYLGRLEVVGFGAVVSEIVSREVVGLETVALEAVGLAVVILESVDS